MDDLIQKIKHDLGVTSIWMMTTMPRGSLQVVQPAGVNETAYKGYTKEFHTEDVFTWTAIMRRRAVKFSETMGGLRFRETFLRPMGIEHGIALPVRAPVFDGYPGAVQLWRTAEQGEFSSDEMDKALAMVRELDQLITRDRETRRAARPKPPVEPIPRAVVRQFAFDKDLRPILLNASISVFDSRLQQGILQCARQQMQQFDGHTPVNDRVLLSDEYGDHWPFKVVVHPSYPALSHGPVVLFCLQPPNPEWALLRPQDFRGDEEAARMVPAIEYMANDFAKGITLKEIAKHVHLSPFHFHRRFSEVFGITPKHFLLECQAYAAKVLLMARDKDLPTVATECGFAHQSHFTSRFKQAAGLTPTRWRRMVGERLLRGGVF